MVKYLRSVMCVGVVAYIIKALAVLVEIIAFFELEEQMGFRISVDDLHFSDWYNAVPQLNQFFYLLTAIFMFALVVIFVVDRIHGTFFDLMIFTALVNGLINYGFYREFSYTNGNIAGIVGSGIIIAFFYSLYRISSNSNILKAVVIIRAILLFVAPLYGSHPIVFNLGVLISCVVTAIGLHKFSKTVEQDVFTRQVDELPQENLAKMEE